MTGMPCKYPDNTPSTAYGKGCRCPRCRGWQSERNRTEYAARKRAQAQRDESLLEGDRTDEVTVPVSRITSIEDMVAHLELDLDAYDVKRYWVGVQERRDGPAFKVSAQIEPKHPVHSEAGVEAMFDEFVELVANHGPDDSVLPRPEVVLADSTEPQMLEIALMDPHLGMLAWGKEVGLPYDLSIGLQEYRLAFNALLAVADHYNIEKVLFLVGNDLFHVDGTMEGGKGATTTKGTQQDFDTRLARMFVKVENLIVECIEDAAQRFEVDVQMIPGNHDRHTVFKLGRVLDAWFRQVDHVTVRNVPSVRDYYLYGNNLFMFTHGLEFKRKRDNLVSVFATECPPELWVKGRIREIHVGHNHINMEKVYTGDPHELVWEGRATRVRSLPGLTPEDAWHFEEGYKHTRRGTALVWNRDGGLAGLHEFLL